MTRRSAWPSAAAGARRALITTRRATGAWDDSPWVTAVGGSIPNLSATGKRLGPDRVWNLALPRRPGARKVRAPGSPRSTPGRATRTAWPPSPGRNGGRFRTSRWTPQAERLRSAPLLAGVLALATQLNHGKNVGPVNNALYHVLGPAGLKDGIADVVSGNNTLIIHRKVYVRGFTAAKGFDVASGWGTVRASTFVPALAHGYPGRPPGRRRACPGGRSADQARAPRAAQQLLRRPGRHHVADRAGLPAPDIRSSHVYRRPQDRDPARRRARLGQLPDQTRQRSGYRRAGTWSTWPAC